uniref:Uncharacterized protein n=1 Tax=Anopheles merus TaxID=30066 RepID=A0A182URA1_ANOME
MSQMRSVLSMELLSTYEPSGDRDSPVTVSVWPRSRYSISFFRMSHTLISLSIPPDTTCSAVSLKHTAVTWYVLSNVLTTWRLRASQILIDASSDPDTISVGPRRAPLQLFTKCVWPFSLRMRVHVGTSHTPTTLSVAQV